MGIILCDDILELIGKKVERIRNQKWWEGLYGYNTSFEKYAGGISHEFFRQKNLSSYHAAQIGCHFTWQLSIPPIGGYPEKVLQYILSTWHTKCELNAYTCLPSYNTMRRILNNSKKNKFKE